MTFEEFLDSLTTSELIRSSGFKLVSKVEAYILEDQKIMSNDDLKFPYYYHMKINTAGHLTEYYSAVEEINEFKQDDLKNFVIAEILENESLKDQLFEEYENYLSDIGLYEILEEAGK